MRKAEAVSHSLLLLPRATHSAIKTCCRQETTERSFGPGHHLGDLFQMPFVAGKQQNSP